MSDNNPYLKSELKYFLHTFKRQPLFITKAKGSTIWDKNGKSYLDFYSGIAVCSVGHTNKNVVKAIQKQATQLIHSSNFFYNQPQMTLAGVLAKKLPNSRVFFSNTGAEANECAIKLARLWAYNKKKPGRTIITFHNAFHGRTLATAAASGGGTGNVKRNQYFAPLPAGFVSVPFNDLAAVKKVMSKNTIAVLLEPIQGEGGVNIATKDFLRGLAALCKKYKSLLIIDEIQSGLGRTGTFFAFEQYGVTPDIVTLAKGLAGGLPLGATLAKTHVSRYMVPGLHGSTFGGNPVACAASLEVLKQLSPRMLKSISERGQYLLKKLSGFTHYPSVKTTRGMGLMSAIELNCPGAPYVTLARKKGLLMNCTQESVLRFLPSYVMSKSEIDKGLKILKTVFDDLNPRRIT